MQYDTGAVTYAAPVYNQAPPRQYDQGPVTYAAPTYSQAPPRQYETGPVTYAAPAYGQAPTYGAPPPAGYAQQTYATGPAMTYGAPAQSYGQQPSMFDQIDANHDGQISRAEFQAMMGQQ